MKSIHIITILTTFVLKTTYSTNSTNTTQIQTTNNFPVGHTIDQTILSRQRRFISDSGWTFEVTFTLTVPLEGVGSSATVEVPFKYTFDPDEFSSGTISGRSFETGAARTFSSHEDHRHSILRTVESYIERLGGFHDGHACILRAICEVAETPQNTDGFLGDLVNMMLAPVYLLDGFNGDIGEDTDYIIAQKDGYFGRDCSRYHHECPASLFSYIDGNDYDDNYNYAYGGSSYANYTHDYPYPDQSTNEIF